MCGSMADIQSPTAEIRRGKKKRKKKNKRQMKMWLAITYGDHKKLKKGTLNSINIFITHNIIITLYASLFIT